MYWLKSWHWRTGVWYGNDDPKARSRNDMCVRLTFAVWHLYKFYACVNNQTNRKLNVFFSFIHEKSVCILSSHFYIIILLAFQASHFGFIRRKCMSVPMYTWPRRSIRFDSVFPKWVCSIIKLNEYRVLLGNHMRHYATVDI